jgi:hypothetical protein
MSFQSKNSLVLGRQLKVQRLVIPFTVTGNATPASVVLRSDEPGILFLRSEGVDQITTASGALASGETATYSTAADDSDGIMNLFVKLQSEDVCVKVLRASVVSRTNGVQHPTMLGDADGISSAGNIMLTLDSTINFSAPANLDGCVEVEYIVAE